MDQRRASWNALCARAAAHILPRRGASSHPFLMPRPPLESSRRALSSHANSQHDGRSAVVRHERRITHGRIPRRGRKTLFTDTSTFRSSTPTHTRTSGREESEVARTTTSGRREHQPTLRRYHAASISAAAGTPTLPVAPPAPGCRHSPSWCTKYVHCRTVSAEASSNSRRQAAPCHCWCR